MNTAAALAALRRLLAATARASPGEVLTVAGPGRFSSTAGVAGSEVVAYTGLLPAYAAGNDLAIDPGSGTWWQRNAAGDGWTRPNLDMQLEDVAIVAGVATITRDAAWGRAFRVTLDDDLDTLTIEGNAAAAYVGTFVLYLVQDATGGRAVSAALSAELTWEGGEVPTFDLAAGSVTEIVARTIDGGAIWYATAATLFTPGPVPTITAHPSAQTAGDGGTATFAVTASDADTYQWERSDDGGTTWADISGATASSYTTGVLSIAGDDGAEFRVRVANANGTVTSNAATLTVSTSTPVTFVAASSTNDNGTAEATKDITLPAGIASGDLIEIIVAAAGGSDPGAATATGYTERASIAPSSSFRPRVTKLYKIADGSESSTTVTVNVSPTNTQRCTVGAIVLRGVDTSTPYGTIGTDTQGPGSAPTWVGATTGRDNSMAVAYLGSQGTTDPYDAVAGWDLRVNEFTQSRGLAVWTQPVATSGTTADPDDQTTTRSNWTTLVDIVQPIA